MLSPKVAYIPEYGNSTPILIGTSLVLDELRLLQAVARLPVYAKAPAPASLSILRRE